MSIKSPRAARRVAPIILGIAAPMLAAPSSHAAVQFNHVFAPQQGVTVPQEQPYRAEMCLNGSWRFQPVPLPSSFKQDAGAPDLPPPTAGGWDTTPIKIPSPWNVNAFNVGDGGDFRSYPSYPKSWDKTEMGWLKKDVAIPVAWKGRRLLLRFGAIAGNADILVNGHKVGENFDLFLPAEYDITDQVKFGASNEILVGVRKASLFNVKGPTGSRPYPGGSMWGQAIAGIWQDVNLVAVAPLHVDDTYINPQVSKDTLSDDVTLRNDSEAPQTVRVSADVSPWVNEAGTSVLDAPEPRWKLGKSVLTIPAQTVTVPAGKTITVSLSGSVKGALKTWSPETPNLYGMVVSVSSGGNVLDRKYTRFGWREFTFQGNHQFLNGKQLELRGDSWHFMGVPQMTRRYAWAWFKALKDANGNAVRLHAQPYPEFYLDVADEMGVCVLDETATWGSDAGHKYDSPEFWTRADDHIRRLVLRDRNHAGVFGWSVSNEVGWCIEGKHPDLMDRLKQGWKDWLTTAHTLDPSRPWVSTDGDSDAKGIMPTSVMHYAGPKDIVRADRPFGEGETGGAYYATPKYASQFNGARSYESQQGRMEGIAIEAYGQIKEQREVGASYASVFNLVWYGLKPLALGQPDTTRPYTSSDGIFFPGYKEGQPGVQPERLGPYTTTLNPGYDPRLPLYSPWPLADAIKAANAPGGSAPSPGDHKTGGDPPPAAAPAGKIESVVVLSDAGSLLPNELEHFGATVKDASALGAADFIVIDGAAPPTDSGLKQRIESRVRQGATCLVIGATPATLSALNALLPQPVTVTDCKASSLLVKSPDQLVSGMDNATFYFTETSHRPVIDHGLGGPFVTSGRVILTACPTDWSKWNGNAEAIKTAATIRSERETGPAGAALVESKLGSGRYLLTSIDLTSPSMDVLNVVTRMMGNAGVRFQERQADSSAALDMVGHLSQVLACGRFGGTDMDALYDTDHIGINDALKPTAGSKSGGKTWTLLKAGPNSAFDFKRPGLDGPTDNAAVYLSFWLWSPRPLDNLLIEPNMPRLDLLMGSDDGCQVWLNSKLIKEDKGVHPMTPDSIVAEALPLQRGWNHIVVKVVQGGGDWAYTARLHCSDAKFLLGLKSDLSPPAPGT